MLGYVRIDKGELKVREYEIYTGYYCGICKYIGKEYGQLPRMALSYDAAFLALLLACIDGTPDSPVQEHCIAHQLQKKTVIRNKAIEYAGDVMLILAWYKLADDAADEGRLYAKGTKLLMHRIFRKLQRKHPELCEGIHKQLEALTELENSRCDSIDMAAEAFARIMQIIFTAGARHLYGDSVLQSSCKQSACEKKEAVSLSVDDMHQATSLNEALSEIGYHMGKWIYLIDAADDIEENIESGAYNPLLYRFSYDSTCETAEQFRRRIAEHLNFNLYMYLSVIGKSLDALDIKKNKGIIENVIYFGLNRKTEEIINNDEESVRRT
ncbi:MAG: DUF5685 family protein [Bacillota bacterium]|nr:DUF5685 family protein [Bacillota bacterium]